MKPEKQTKKTTQKKNNAHPITPTAAVKPIHRHGAAASGDAKTTAHAEQQTEVSKSVGAVVLNPQYQVLLMFQKKNKYWEFPKGKVEAQEREIDTLKREIAEETGICHFRMLKNFRKVMYYDFRYKGRIIRRKVVYFLIKTNDPVQISDEHMGFAWLTLEKAKKRLKHKNHSQLIDQVIQRIYGK